MMMIIMVDHFVTLETWQRATTLPGQLVGGHSKMIIPLARGSYD